MAIEQTPIPGKPSLWRRVVRRVRHVDHWYWIGGRWHWLPPRFGVWEAARKAFLADNWLTLK